MMLRNDDQAWDECPDAESCELIHSFLELVDSMVRDIQHLKAETIRARYELSQKYDREHTWITTVDILSDLDMPHYDNLAYAQSGQRRPADSRKAAQHLAPSAFLRHSLW